MIREVYPADALRVAEFMRSHIDSHWNLKMVMTEIKCHKALGYFVENHLVAIVLFRNLPDFVEISWLATHPGFRRKGLMKRLLTKLFEACGQNQPVWLELRESNRAALSLYEACGFKKVGERKAYYSNGEKATLMEYKPLQSL